VGSPPNPKPVAVGGTTTTNGDGNPGYKGSTPVGHPPTGTTPAATASNSRYTPPAVNGGTNPSVPGAGAAPPSSAPPVNGTPAPNGVR
jgi:hypothetical protein